MTEWHEWSERAIATGRFEMVPAIAAAEAPAAPRPRSLTQLCAATGAVLVDGGWLRLLGSGTADLPGVDVLERVLATRHEPGILVIGVDVLGGVLALDAGAIERPDGEACYWAPDSLEWVRLGLDHGDLLTWLLSDGMAEFYEPSRWESWEADLRGLAPDSGFLTDPPLWSQDAEDIEDCVVDAAAFTDVVDAAHRGVDEAGGDRYPFTAAQWRAALTNR